MELIDNTPGAEISSNELHQRMPTAIHEQILRMQR